MVHKCCRFTVIDNTGAKEANFFAVPGRNSLKVRVGDVINVSITKVLANKAVKKGAVHKAVISGLKKPFNNKGKTRTSFSENMAILVNDKGMIGSRILAPISSSPVLRNKYPDVTSRGDVY